MNRLTTFLIGMVVGAAGLFLTENYYVVRSEDSFHFVPKVAAKIEFPYRDIRRYTVEDWNKDPSLGLALVKAKKQNLMAESGVNNLQQKFEGLLKSLGGN